VVRVGTELPVRVGEHVVGVGRRAAHAKRLGQILNGLLVLATLDERHAELVEGALEALVEQRVLPARELGYRCAPVLLGGLPLILVHGDERETGECVGVVGRYLESRVELLDRLVQPAVRGERLGKSEAKTEVLRVLVDCGDEILDRLRRGLQPALLNLEPYNRVREIGTRDDHSDQRDLDRGVKPAYV
jgi:hypothetical protein